jgi:N-acetylornithine carbamoyltransferase
MRHFTQIHDLGPEGVQRILNLCEGWKRSGPGKHLQDKLLGMVFFNPSLRTRASFEAAMVRGGGDAIVLEVGQGVWKLEDREGVRMDGDRAEHVKEAVPVLSRYVDALAVRTFAEGKDDAADHADPVMNAFRKHSTVPVISMESAREHPCQGLADLLTVREAFGRTKDVTVTLTWAPHIKPLPKAVPNSFLLTAAAAGCKVRVVHPKGFELRDDVLAEAKAYATTTGGSVEVTHDQQAALEGSSVLYAKAWGPATGAGPVDLDQPTWMPTLKHFEGMAKDAIFLHCLPTRRNLEVSDDVLDSKHSRVVDEAENRFHVQRALLHELLGRK